MGAGSAASFAERKDGKAEVMETAEGFRPKRAGFWTRDRFSDREQVFRQETGFGAGERFLGKGQVFGQAKGRRRIWTIS